MPELPGRIDGEIVYADHMNDAQIRAVQRYNTEATRDTLNPAPETGQPAWIIDIAELQIWDGTTWKVASGDGVYLPLTGGTLTGILTAPDFGLRNDGPGALDWRDAAGTLTDRWSMFRDTDGYLKIFSNADDQIFEQRKQHIGTQMFVQDSGQSVVRNIVGSNFDPTGQGIDGDVWMNYHDGIIWIKVSGTWRKVADRTID